MYDFRKRHIIIGILLAIPVIISFLPEAKSNSIRLCVTRFFQTPLSKSAEITNKLQTAISPRGFFTRHLAGQRQQIQQLKAENAFLKEAFLENQRADELASFRQELGFKSVPAKIIARDPANWRHSVIINRGALNGVKKNMFLVSRQGLVGRISDAGRTAAKALLLTDPDFRVAGICQRSREQMIVTGSARDLCVLKYLPQDADVRPGDIIVTSGLGGFCPNGILIGEVAGVRKSSDGLALQAFLKPSAYLNRLEEALVLTE